MKNRKSLSCDFLIIGGGTIGLPVSIWLSEQTNKKIICIEAGSDKKTVMNFFGNSRLTGDIYHGAENGRRFGLGGTSSVWGGALAPFYQNDCIDYDWPISSKELMPFSSYIEDLFSLPRNRWPNIFSDSLDDNYVLRNAIWPAFNKRNVYKNLKNRVKKHKNLTILHDSPVIKIETNDSISNVTVSNKMFSNIKSKKIIVCAGAIESTRLAMLISNNNRIGKGFCDHLSAPIGKIVPNNRDNLNKQFAFKFIENSSMISCRFELSNNSNDRKKIPPHNFHISPIDINDKSSSPFNHIRNIMRAMQERSFPKLRDIFGVFTNIGWFLKFVFWFLFKKTLLWPEKTDIELHLVIQQEVNEKNSLALDADNIDRFGNPITKINWKIKDKDIMNINLAIDAFNHFWNKSDNKKYGKLELYDIKSVKEAIKECGGIYHPTSSLSFGNKDIHPIDKNLYLKGAKNIQFVSTAILPTGGGINPTMMALLLSARCVHQHANCDKN